MGSWLKQSTAVTVKFGPFLDSTDGDTEEIALTISQADILLSKNGGAFAQTNNVAGATHDTKGLYGVPLDTTDTNTLGELRVYIHESGALAVWETFMVVSANVWDSMFGADLLQTDLTQIGGVAQSATDLKDFADAGYDPATSKVQGVVLVDTTTANTDMVAAAPTAVQNRQEMDTNSVDLNTLITNLAAVDTVVDAIKVITDALPDSGALTAIGTDTARLTAVRAAVLTDWINGGRLDLLLDAIPTTAMRGTDNAALATAMVTAQNDLDLLTGADGATLATSQPNYAPNTVVPDAAGTAPTAVEINAEVVDVLKTDTIAEITQGTPTATPTFEEAIMYLYMMLRNKIDVDSGFKEFYNDAGTVIWKKALSDDGSNYVEAEGETGP